MQWQKGVVHGTYTFSDYVTRTCTVRARDACRAFALRVGGLEQNVNSGLTCKPMEFTQR